MKNKFLKIIAGIITCAILITGIPMLVTSAQSIENGSGVVAKWVLEPKGAQQKIASKTFIQANNDGSRRVAVADDFGVTGLEASLPAGDYYMKFYIKIVRGTGSKDENARPIFMRAGDNDVESPNLSWFPDGEWKQVITPFVVSAKNNNKRLPYNIKGPIPGVVGGTNGYMEIGREIVISTNAEPLPDYDVERAYFADDSGSTIRNNVTDNNDGSITSTAANSNMVSFKATLAAGTYYVKFTTRTSSKSMEANLNAPISKFTSDGGVSVNLPNVGTYTNGVWQNNCIKFTTDGNEHTYTISGPMNGAIDLSVARDIIICKTDTPLDPPQNGDFFDYVIPASNIGQKIACNTNWAASYNQKTDALEISGKATNQFVWDINVKSRKDIFVNSGDVPKGKFYIKVVAKVPALATSGTKNTKLFDMEMVNGSTSIKTENVNFGEFTQAGEWQTIIKEFDASNYDSFQIRCKYFADVSSNLDIKSIVISSNNNPVQDSTIGTSGIQWPADQLMPSFGTPAEVMYLVDMSGAADSDKITFRCLQGLVNRTQPRIIITESTDTNWRDLWPSTMGIRYSEITGTIKSKLEQLIRMFKDEISGYVKYNVTYGGVVGIAATVCGIENSIPLDVTQITTLTGITDLNLQMKTDLSSLTFGIDNDGYLAAGNYLYNNYKGKYNDRVIIQVPWGDSDPNRKSSNLLDLAVAIKAPVVWLNSSIKTPGSNNPYDLVGKYLDDIRTAHPATITNVGGVSLGFWPDEGAGVRQTTTYGITSVPSDNFENYTVYSALSREIDPPSVPKKPILGNYNYVSIISSDGDNICTSEGATRLGNMWGDRNRGQAFINWTISPALIDAAPKMLQYYYSSATDKDAFICGPSGLGYTQSAYSTSVISSTRYWPDGDWPTYYAAWTNDYFERTNLNSVTVWNNFGGSLGTSLTNATNLRNQFTDFAAFPSLLGIYQQAADGRSGEGNTVTKWGNNRTPSQSIKVNYATEPDHVVRVTNEINALTKNPAAPTFNSYQYQTFAVRYNAMSEQQRSIATDSPNVKFVRSDHYFMLMSEANGLPINNALQESTYSSGSDDGFESGKAVDGSFGKTHGWKSSASGDKWLVVDFGRRVDISRYVLKNAETAYQPAANNTKDYKIQVSNDGRTWTDIDSVTGNTDAIVYRNATAAKQRFVRVYITDPGADGIARIQDIEIYGVNNQKLVYNDLLEAEIARTASIVEADYNVTEYLKVKADAIAVNASYSTYSQVQIDDAALALRDAINALSADKTALEELIEIANTKEESDYSTASWKNMKDKLADAIIVRDNTEVKQPVIDAEVIKLQNAINELTVDKTELNELIQAVEAEGYVESNYSAESWKTFQDGLSKANRIKLSATAKQSEINEAVKDLDNAVKGLTIDKTDLIKYIQIAKSKIESDYTEESWLRMQDALSLANILEENDDAKQSEINEALTNLQNAINALTGDMTELKKLVDKIKKDFKEDDYTVESWKKLSDILKDAQEILDKQQSTQTQIDAKIEQLSEAMNALIREIKELPEELTLIVGEKIVLSPIPEDGIWEWDKDFLSATFDSTATFTALRDGKTKITYKTSQGVIHTTNVTILKVNDPDDTDAPGTTDNSNNQLPNTGDITDYPILIAVLLGSALIGYTAKKKRKHVDNE